MILLIGYLGNEQVPAIAQTDPSQSPDAAVAAVPADAAASGDAGPSKEDIVALSRFGFFDDQREREDVDLRSTASTSARRRCSTIRCSPGPHKIKAIGPRNKNQELNISIYATKYHDEGVINW